MQYFNDKISPLGKYLLSFLIILQILVISYKYYSNLSDYITCVILLTSLPTTYYLYQYLRGRYESTGQYNPRKFVGQSLDSNQQVKNLQSQPQFKEFEARKQRREAQVEQSQEELRREKQLLEVIEELEDKQGQIFSQ